MWAVSRSWSLREKNASASFPLEPHTVEIACWCGSGCRNAVWSHLTLLTTTSTAHGVILHRLTSSRFLGGRMPSSVCIAVPLLSTRKYTTTTESILRCSAVVMLTQTDSDVTTTTTRAKASRSSAFSPFTVQNEPMERTAAFVSLLRCAFPSLLLPRHVLRAANCFTLPCTRLAASRCPMR